MNKKTLIWVIAVPLAAMVAGVLLLTAVFGPTDNGLRCARTPDHSECQVLQSRFFGAFSNSSFTIPESAIRAAKGFCPSTKVGGRGGPSCIVSLTLDSGEDYPVLSYVFRSQADASARELNDYFENRSEASIEIKENALTPVLVSGGPILFVAVFLGLRKWRRSFIS